MIRTVAILMVALAAAPCFAAGPAAVSIEAVEPTPLFPKGEPVRQIAYLTATNHTGNAIEAELRAGFDAGQPTTQSVTLPPGQSVHRLLVPDIHQPATLRVAITAKDGGRELASHEQPWQPQRKWKVHIVHSSHEDIGYENYIFEKQHEVADFIDLGRHLSGDPGGSRSYHYTLETLLFQSNYIDERSEPAWRRVVNEDIKPGRMSLMGAPSGVHTQWMDYEVLARMNYPARRETLDRFGLELDTFLLVDNPSMSWSGAQALANAGFRYLVRFGQPWRTGGNNDFASTKVPAIFWWQGPDGESRILYSWRSHYGLSFWYGQPGGGGGHRELLPLAEENVMRELRAVESGELLGPYPYDALIVPSYSDHTIPSFDGRALRNWQQEFAYPEIHVSDPRRFMAYIDEHFADQVPTLSGELNNFSADYAAIDPEGQGRMRRASRLLPLAEGLGAIAAATDPAYLPPNDVIYRSFLHIFDYVEHSWPTAPRVNPFHAFNAQLKTHESRRALDGAEAALASAADALFSSVPTQAPTLVVFNPLAHARTDVVEVELPAGADRPTSLVDLDTGRVEPVEQGPGGKLMFIAHDVPAYGYRSYRYATAQDAAPRDDPSMTAGDDTIENAAYRITFDRDSGGIVSIHDKALDRELVDPSREQFNQLIRYTTSARETDDGVRTSPAGANTATSHAGPVTSRYTVEIDDTSHSGAAVTQTVLLYRGLKRIDVINELRHVELMHSLKHEDRYKENLIYAFPFALDRFEARAEYPGGVVRPHTDQLRWGSHDYLHANRWVDLNDGQAGVTMAPWNAATVYFGDIRYNKFSIDYKPTQPALFSYALSNRMAGLLSRTGEDCNATLRYSFTSYAGDFKTGDAARFGWSIASPLRATLLPAGQAGSRNTTDSFLSIDAPNVQLVTLKQSQQPGRGWVLRLAETTGEGGDVTVTIPGLPFSAATQTDLVENDLHPLNVSGQSVTVKVKPFSMTTLRIYADQAEPGTVKSLRADDITDESLVLRWTAAGRDAAAYNIYRSQDPDAPPTAYTLVGRSTGDTFTDHGLTLGTPYFYRVAAVTAANTQGEPSERLAVTTDWVNTAPPRPVRDLGVILQSTQRVDLYWRRSPEPDVRRYHVHRAAGETADASAAERIGTVEQTGRFLQVYDDQDLESGKTYHYWVFPEDWAGHVQQDSPTARLKMTAP